MKSAENINSTHTSHFPKFFIVYEKSSALHVWAIISTDTSPWHGPLVAIPPFFACFHQPLPPQSPAVSSRHISVKGHMTPTPSRAAYPRRSARASGTSENSHTPTAPSHYTPLHSQASLLRMRSASTTPRVEGVCTVALEEERRGVCQSAYTWRNKRVGRCGKIKSFAWSSSSCCRVEVYKKQRWRMGTFFFAGSCGKCRCE